ncbi:MAG TPA: HAD family hydrolase [Solirubrobacteraceae bacterium]|nr:HAD family hydrolase [Solirubrobacteraceae bacterium]
MNLRRAVFLDRDGTINELAPDPVSGRPESPLRVEDVALMPGAADAIRALSEAGWLLVGVSNQPAAAKGTISETDLLAVHARTLALLEEEGAKLDDFRLCLHHPDGVLPGLSIVCDCRKPQPGLLLAAAHDHGIDLHASWMVGDTDADVLAGEAAGCRTILIATAGSAHKRSGAGAPDAEVATFADAARLIAGA